MTRARVRPQRTCLGCRQVQDQDRLLRYVLTPEGTLLVDYRHKLPGRGAYTCMSLPCIQQAVSRKQFERALRTTVPIAAAEELREQLCAALRDRLEALLGMARKSSQVISGGNLVHAALDQPNRLAVIILADDVSAGVAEKIISKARRHKVPCVSFSTKAALGQLLGRDERSVTALMKGHLAEAFLGEWRKYQEISGES